MTSQIIRKVFSTLIVAILLTSCKTRKIEYSLKDIAPARDPVLSAVTLDIETFKDGRRAIEKNAVLFKPILKQTPGEMEWYWNVDKRYKTDVPEALANMLAEHLRKRASFNGVKVNRKDSADYHIEGTLQFFYGAQSPGRAEGAFLVGAILPPLAIPLFIWAVTEKSKTVVVIDIKELSIYNRKNELVFKTDMNRRYERKYRSWGGFRAVYKSANRVLKDFNTELTPLIEAEIRKAEGK